MDDIASIKEVKNKCGIEWYYVSRETEENEMDDGSLSSFIVLNNTWGIIPRKPRFREGRSLELEQ